MVCCLPCFEHIYDITDLPEALIDACRHCRGDFVRDMNFHKVVVHRMKCEGVDVVLDLLRKLRESYQSLAWRASRASIFKLTHYPLS